MTLYEKAVATLPAKDIDHHCSDLYIRKTSASDALIREYEEMGKKNPGTTMTVTVFRDNIDHVLWYEIPFAYDPHWKRGYK